jgi:hypothetical protein
VAAAVVPAYGAAAAPAALKVTTGADAGPGSLRAAVTAANADPSFSSIEIAPSVGTIALQSAVEYTGSLALSIEGGSATIAANGATGDLLRSTGGAALTLRRLTLSGAPGRGLYVKVPANASGDQVLVLMDVTVEDSGGNAVYVDDCLESDLPAACAGDDGGSAAGVRMRLIRSTIRGNGVGAAADLDGIRIDERSEGSVVLDMQQSLVTGNSSDGIEIDESDAGNVTFIARASSFTDNGEQPQAPDDPQDAADIDERGDGSVFTDLVQVVATGNFDENFDFNEADEGDLEARLVQATIADALTGRGYDLEETGAGSIRAIVSNADIAGSDSDGMRAAEADDGDVTLDVNQSSFVDNGDDGIDVAQDDAGGGTASVKNSEFAGNSDDPIDDDGVVLTLLNVTGV